MAQMQPGRGSLQEFMKQQQETWEQTRQQQAGWKLRKDRQRRQDEQWRAAAQRQAMEPFRRAEAEAGRLRTARAAGRLTDDQYAGELRRLMVRDASGAWWSLGRDSGQWYRYTGTGWSPGNPAARLSVGPPVVGRPRAHPLRALFTLAVFLALTLAAAAFAGDAAGGSGAVVAAALGLLVTLFAVRRAWRRR